MYFRYVANSRNTLLQHGLFIRVSFNKNGILTCFDLLYRCHDDSLHKNTTYIEQVDYKCGDRRLHITLGWYQPFSVNVNDLSLVVRGKPYVAMSNRRLFVFMPDCITCMRRIKLNI